MINIIPVNDILQHDESSTCHCHPSLVMENGEMILVHNSFYSEVFSKFKMGELALRRNHGFPDEPNEWVEFSVNETYARLIAEFPDYFRKIQAKQ